MAKGINALKKIYPELKSQIEKIEKHNKPSVENFNFIFKQELFEEDTPAFGEPRSWRIDIAKKILKKKSRPTIELNVETYYLKNSKNMNDISMHLFGEVDTNFPVIAATVSLHGDLKIIDGNHRLYKAYKIEHRRTIPAWVLDRDEVLEVLGRERRPIYEEVRVGGFKDQVQNRITKKFYGPQMFSDITELADIINKNRGSKKILEFIEINFKEINEENEHDFREFIYKSDIRKKLGFR
jgi:hypothetical protein